ncbi:3,4-dihydroxy-2-butanone-4-phosphate synthase [Nocardia sp. R6R-6]|uniref:3,4-dihydroxy-2-butanone-4-phosphate synthase n=1 Tax=Nocardia sp. R6R-6 TaxID=3459303 RepID=UPI00403DB0E0
MSDRVKDALCALIAGKPIVIADGTGGDLMCAAESVTPALVSFLVRYTSGYLCVALPESDADRLGLPPMVSGEPYAVTVDARQGTGTGISARDRACTARRLADPSTVASDLSRPGHVVPVRAKPGGVLDSAGRAEAATDLARLAGLRPAALLGAIVSETAPATMAQAAELAEFGARHGLCVLRIQDLVRFQRRQSVQRVDEISIWLRDKQFRCLRYRDFDGREHIALVLDDIEDGIEVLVRVHAECLTGDVFGSCECECNARLRESIVAICTRGRGVLVYVREGTKDSAAVTAAILGDHGVESTARPMADFDDPHPAHAVAMGR